MGEAAHVPRSGAADSAPKAVPVLSGAGHARLEARTAAAPEREYAQLMSARAIGPRPVQRAPNRTGLPDGLKAGVEALSGVSLDGVKVHYNSPKPAQIDSFAYAQGRDIHLGPEQERHLPHEAWHIVQQAQGRVRATRQMQGRVLLNDDVRLEREADAMGAKAAAAGQMLQRPALAAAAGPGRGLVQRVVYPHMATMWAAVEPTQPEAQIKAITDADTALSQVYADVEALLAHMDFVYQAGKQPEAGATPDPNQVYSIYYGLRTELRAPYNDATRYVGAILHEMMHVAAGLQFDTNVPGGSIGHAANMNLPIGVGAVEDAEVGLTANQFDDVALGAGVQIATMMANWDTLRDEADDDLQNQDLQQRHRDFIHGRIDYAIQAPAILAHYDTVLTDILYYLRSEGVAASRSYQYAHLMLTEANARRLAAVGPIQRINPIPPPVPAAPETSFWNYLLCCFRGQAKAIRPTGHDPLEREADVMGARALAAGGGAAVAQLQPAVVQRGAKPGKEGPPVYQTWTAADAGYTYAWDGRQVNVASDNEEEPLGFARYDIENIEVPVPAPAPGEQYTFDAVKARQAGIVAHLTRIENQTLTRDGPADIYKGFADQLMAKVEARAREEGARMIYLEPSKSLVRKSPDSNEKELRDPAGYYARLGYGYDDVAVAHNNALVDRDFADLPDDQKAVMKKQMNAAALGGVMQKLL